MKLQIDTTNKTISSTEEIPLSELFEFLEKTFPNDEWKDFKFCFGVFSPVQTPIIIEKHQYIPWYQEPYRYPWIQYTGDSSKFDHNDYRLKTGLYSVNTIG